METNYIYQLCIPLTFQVLPNFPNFHYLLLYMHYLYPFHKTQNQLYLNIYLRNRNKIAAWVTWHTDRQKTQPVVVNLI